VGAIEGMCGDPQFSIDCPSSCEVQQCASQTSGDPADVTILKMVFAELSAGNSTGAHLSFNPATDPCMIASHWSAVRCDHSMPYRRVTAFHVRKNKLGVTFASSLLQLPELKILGMISAGLTGELPDDIGLSLPLLEYVSFEDNRLSGSLPTSLVLLKNLRYANFRNNLFDGHMPSYGLDSVQKLDLSMNRLSGTLVPYNATGLERLQLSSNRISGTVPNEWFGEMHSMKILELYENRLSGTMVHDIANMSTIVRIDLHNHRAH
jgi:hypothetical protein